jgi:hypothetical protein
MTGDEFHARYALLEQVAGEGARSFRATAPGGGEVMVHFLDGGVTPANLALLTALERLEAARRAQVREVAAVDGIVAVVTDPIPAFRSLPAWIEAAPSASAGTPPPADSAPPGEFTRLFRAMDPSAVMPPPAAPALPEPAPPVAAGPGAYTRLFQQLEMPDRAVQPRERPAPTGDAAPPGLHPGRDAGSPAGDEYLERLYAPGPERGEPSALEPARAEADAPAPFPLPASSSIPSSSAPSAGEASSPASAPAAGPAASRPTTPLAAVLAVVAVLAVLAILFVLLR